MSEETSSRFPVSELIKAGPDAPLVLVRHIVEKQGSKVARTVATAREAGSYDVEAYVDSLIASHLMLARGQGAGGGALVAAATLPAMVAGPATATAAAVTTILSDLVALSWIQARLALYIAAAYGHDATDPERAREILAFAGLDIAAGQGATPVVAQAGQRVGKRLLERYLKGNVLMSIKAMFRLVGIKFSRAALVRGLPLINIPAGAVVSDVTTRHMATKARKFYATLPVSA